MADNRAYDPKQYVEGPFTKAADPNATPRKEFMDELEKLAAENRAKKGGVDLDIVAAVKQQLG